MHNPNRPFPCTCEWGTYLRITSDAAKTACGSHQLCAGLTGGIEGAIHGTAQNFDGSAGLLEQERGFLLLDATSRNDAFSQ